MPLYTYYYKIIRYLYSYSYTLTNFGLLLAFIGLFSLQNYLRGMYLCNLKITNYGIAD